MAAQVEATTNSTTTQPSTEMVLFQDGGVMEVYVPRSVDLSAGTNTGLRRPASTQPLDVVASSIPQALKAS